jgi:phytoene dehydrogenase-like protein
MLAGAIETTHSGQDRSHQRMRFGILRLGSGSLTKGFQGIIKSLVRDEEIAQAERTLSPNKPFVLLGQPSLFDSSRAPAGQHTAWAYCHVPNGSTEDYVESIERQIVRYAPGFRDCILSRSVSSPKALESWNPNLVGGDILGGAMNVRQLLFRPTRSLYRTSRSGLYLCGASTPPGGGVHGMCGFHAAKMALADLGL